MILHLQALLHWLVFLAFVLIAPPLTIGIIRKTKARMQNRIGAPIFQPLLDLQKFLKKGETISTVTSWVFRNTSVVSLIAIFAVACLVPWVSFKPAASGADIFYVIYLLALARFFTVLAALDAGSVFGGFGASREVTLALLVEPAIVLCFASLGCVAHTSDLNQIFAFSEPLTRSQSSLWTVAGTGLFIASLVELSRMPVDDPTTHLELTMVHEAMFLEYSGRNFAIAEYTHYLKLCVMFGVAGQCFMHAIPFFWNAGPALQALGSIAALLISIVTVALIESTVVKLRWTKLPEFISYSVIMSLLCVFIAIIRG
jgi:formate hydrogenlyase subunit 4